MGRNESSPTCNRRAFLKQGSGLVAMGAVYTLLPVLGGCGGNTEDDTSRDPVEVPLAMAPEGRRVTIDFHGHPVELLREGDNITARSLRCTHQGCKVRWQESEQLYVCPCHEGKFDASGRVVYGQPRRPLRLFQAVIAGQKIRVSG